MNYESPTPLGSEVRSCPDCDELAATRSIKSQQFPYGTPEKQVVLEAMVPVWTCGKCGYEYTDHEAEDLRHAAVCAHLGLIPPSSIVSMRKRLGLTQEDLAELTQLGKASIKRWETGNTVQNASADMLLRLCDDQVSRCVMVRISRERQEGVTEPNFRTPITESQRVAANVFKLRTAV